MEDKIEKLQAQKESLEKRLEEVKGKLRLEIAKEMKEKKLIVTIQDNYE